MQRLKILLVGHACAPDAGSEPGLTWNWAWHLSEHHDVWVTAHPQHRTKVEFALRGHVGRAPRVVWVALPSWLDPWHPDRGEAGLHLHYVLWQHAVLAQAQRLHRALRFDIVHHVSWGTINAPPLVWRLGAPFVWGPLGGGQAAPLRFRHILGPRGAIVETGRTIRRRLAPFTLSLRRAVAHSALILATNQETAEVLRRAGARHVEMFLDNGIPPDQITASNRTRGAHQVFELVWVGRIEARKALPLALEAVAELRDLPVRLTVAGDGPLRQTCERRAAELGMSERVRFLGMVPRTRVRELFASSDALLFTSLQDGFGSVVLEAMAAGLPVIGLDHQGVGALVPQQAAMKIPVTSPEATVRGLASAIRRLAASPALATRLSEAARGHAATESWSRRVVRVNELYRRCLESSNGRTRFHQVDNTGAVLSKASA
jgi:glycosyltransferase involved in cell wall biosynthesis